MGVGRLDSCGMPNSAEASMATQVEECRAYDETRFSAHRSQTLQSPPPPGSEMASQRSRIEDKRMIRIKAPKVGLMNQRLRYCGVRDPISLQLGQPY
jgi:hypothetical protein